MANGDDTAQGKDGQTPAPAEGGDFSAPLQIFFQQVADGVIEAQEHLDRESKRYLIDRAKAQQEDGLTVAPAAAFRIPKVSAEFTLAAEKRDERGINFIVSVAHERREMMQQKVSFDIISVPLPVDEAAGVIEATPLAAPPAEPPAARPADAAPVAAVAPPPPAQRAPGEDSFPLAEIMEALSKVQDDEDQSEKETDIAKQFEENSDRWVRIAHPSQWILLYSPKATTDSERVLHMAVIDRKSMEAKVYTSDARRLRTILEQLAMLVSSYPDG